MAIRELLIKYAPCFEFFLVRNFPSTLDLRGLINAIHTGKQVCPCHPQKTMEILILFKYKDYLMKEKSRHFWIIAGFLLIGFIFRLYPLQYKNIINPDGVRYINQAKAILDGNFDLAINCGFEFLSIYHFLIPVFYKIFGEWIIAAKSISLLFGTLTIIPFYLITKQFFRNKTVLMATLAFTINPFLVSHSEDLIRGPIFWFFALFGVFFFISSINKEGKEHYLILSSIFFLAAGWARFEAVVFFIGTLLYILFTNKDRLKRFFLFCFPMLFISFSVLFGLLIYQKGYALWSFYLGPRVTMFFRDFLDIALSGNIIEKSISAIGAISFRVIRVFYAFLIFLLLGLVVVKKELIRNRHLSYFILLSSLSFVTLFLFYLKTESIVDRYVAIIMLPAFIFVCPGIEETIRYFKGKGFKEDKIITGIVFFILITVVAFPHNLVHKRTDQLVYEEAGRYIASIEKNRLVKVTASDSRVSFFANLNAGGIDCTNNNSQNYNLLMKMNYLEMVSTLKESNMKYFFWEEGRWRDADYNFLSVAKSEHFQEIMRWNTEDKKVKLFRVK